VLKWCELSANHLKDLKDDVHPLKEGESLINVPQQDREKQEASDLLSELKSEMKRSVGNFHMKATPIGFSATARKKMPCFRGDVFWCEMSALRTPAPLRSHPLVLALPSAHKCRPGPARPCANDALFIPQIHQLVGICEAHTFSNKSQ
jgi:hypothetical protein